MHVLLVFQLLYHRFRARNHANMSIFLVRKITEQGFASKEARPCSILIWYAPMEACPWLSNRKHGCAFEKHVFIVFFHARYYAEEEDIHIWAHF